MNAVIHAWIGWPNTAALFDCWRQHRQSGSPHALHLLIATDTPPAPSCFSSSENPDLIRLNHRLQRALRYWQQQARYPLLELLPDTTVLWLPEKQIGTLQAQHWHGAPPVQTVTVDHAAQPWLALPPTLPLTHALIIGAGIAGAASAYALARRGARVTIIEKDRAAKAASGNRQGLLYAKISAHSTAQTELLLAAYGYSRQLLDLMLPENECWQPCGVLHLNHNAAETRRNRQLAAQQTHSTLYRAVTAAEAADLAGIAVAQDGLWWPHGAWIHPPTWVAALLDHPNITLIESATVRALTREHGQWWLDYRQHGHTHRIDGSHVVVCAGADSAKLPLLQGWPLQQIRGQTTVAQAGMLAPKLRCALSGASYISPAWQDQVCFGASFVPNNGSSDWRAHEQQHNWQQLARLHPALAADLNRANPDITTATGHASVRCDSFDHLPVIGPVGDAAAMRRVYAPLAADKNRRQHQPCPWLPGVYVNTAHGSRGLATAPVCAEAVASALLGLPSPLSPRLQRALHPNRLVIRSLTHHQPWPQGGS